MSREVWGDENDTGGAFDAAIEAGWINPVDQSKALIDVMNERDRQQDEEGWTPAHDDQHVNGEMARAAAAYALGADRVTMKATDPFNPVREISTYIWPWDRKWWKPRGGARRMLVKAAALMIAEIERMDRAQARLDAAAMARVEGGRP